MAKVNVDKGTYYFLMVCLILLFGLIVVGFDYLLIKVDHADPTEVIAFTLGALGLFAYTMIWGAFEPLSKSTQRILLAGLILINLIYFGLLFWNLGFSFMVKDGDLYVVNSSKYAVSCDRVTLWAYIVTGMLIAALSWAYRLSWSMFHPRYQTNKYVIEVPESSGLGLLGTYGAMKFMDNMSKKKRKHEHKLGTYWGDHNDDGSYNPGAWRNGR